MNGKKINRISQIVRLRQLMKKWHTLALTRKLSQAGRAPSVKQRSGFATTYDSDEEYPTSPPPDVPKGYLAVYVGRERSRFIIPTGYLGRPVFRTLLQKAEEEFGFDHKGGLTIPCESAVFQRVLWFCERNDPTGQKTVNLDDLFNIEWDWSCASQANKISKTSGSNKSLSSLLRSGSLPKSFYRVVV